MLNFSLIINSNNKNGKYSKRNLKTHNFIQYLQTLTRLEEVSIENSLVLKKSITLNHHVHIL